MKAKIKLIKIELSSFNGKVIYGYRLIRDINCKVLSYDLKNNVAIVEIDKETYEKNKDIILEVLEEDSINNKTTNTTLGNKNNKNLSIEQKNNVSKQEQNINQDTNNV